MGRSSSPSTLVVRFAQPLCELRRGPLCPLVQLGHERPELVERDRSGDLCHAPSQLVERRSELFEGGRLDVVRGLLAQLLELAREGIHPRCQNRIRRRPGGQLVQGAADVVHRRAVGGELDASRQCVDLVGQFAGASLDRGERALHSVRELVEPSREPRQAVLNDLDPVEQLVGSADLGGLQTELEIGELRLERGEAATQLDDRVLKLLCVAGLLRLERHRLAGSVPGTSVLAPTRILGRPEPGCGIRPLLGERAGELETGDRTGFDEDLTQGLAALLLRPDRLLELVRFDVAAREEDVADRLAIGGSVRRGLRGHCSAPREHRRGYPAGPGGSESKPTDQVSDIPRSGYFTRSGDASPGRVPLLALQERLSGERVGDERLELADQLLRYRQ